MLMQNLGGGGRGGGNKVYNYGENDKKGFHSTKNKDTETTIKLNISKGNKNTRK